MDYHYEQHFDQWSGSSVREFVAFFGLPAPAFIRRLLPLSMTQLAFPTT
jgi:hypothetical protein